MNSDANVNGPGAEDAGAEGHPHGPGGDLGPAPRNDSRTPKAAADQGQ